MLRQNNQYRKQNGGGEWGGGERHMASKLFADATCLSMLRGKSPQVAVTFAVRNNTVRIVHDVTLVVLVRVGSWHIFNMFLYVRQ